MKRINKMFMRRLKSYIRRGLGLFYQKSYSQCGEDIILRYVFDVLKVATPSYLDIGAHHPKFLSNTFLFYQQGSQGVNVDADPTLMKKFHWSRRRDKNLNVGIGESAGKMDFYIMSSRTLNTFSAEEAHRYVQDCGEVVEQTVPVQVMRFNDVVEKYFTDVVPDFISLDVEGLDFEILTSIDFEICRPTAFCIETIMYKSGDSEAEDANILQIDNFMNGKGYMKYANTYINTIYVDRSKWMLAMKNNSDHDNVEESA